MRPRTRRRRHGLREAVLRAARAAPGATAAEIARRVGCDPTTARRHLRTMTITAASPASTLQAATAADLTAAAERSTGEHRRVLEAAAHTLFHRRLTAAASPDCASGMHGRLAADNAAVVRGRAARNDRCPPLLVRRYAADAHWDVRRTVAVRGDCPPQLRLRLAGDPNPKVRAAVAADRRCGLLALRRLAQDPRLDVRAAAAANPRCPQTLLAVLAGDDEPVVRTAAASHPNTAHATLVALTSDRSTNTRTAARSALQSRAAADPHTPAAGALAGQTVAFTGSFRRLNRRAATAAAQAAGATVQTRVGADTTILIAGETAPASVVGDSGKSAKQRAAENAGVAVIDELRFIAMLPAEVRGRYIQQ